MEHYFKGKNVEHEEVLDEELSRILPPDIKWIKVKAGSKINNLMGPATGALKDQGIVLISGSGTAVTKVVSCAEVVKRRSKASYQSTKLCHRLVEEHWEPTRDDLEPLVVTREIPCLQIALSKEPFETAHRQTRSSIETFLNLSTKKNLNASRNKKSYSNGGNNDKGHSSARELGLDNNKPKKPRNRKPNGKNAGEGKDGKKDPKKSDQKPKTDGS